MKKTVKITLIILVALALVAGVTKIGVEVAKENGIELAIDPPYGIFAR